MSRSWESILRTAIAGTARSPVPEAVCAALHVVPAGDPAQTGLQALPAAWLLQKAAAPVAKAPAPLLPACPPDERPLCSAEAVKCLKAMLLLQVYPGVLPEFFALLHQSGRRLPPENIPLALDYAAHQKKHTGLIREALGPCGGWLAAQHPEWATLYTPMTPDWQTGSPDERLGLLREIRGNRPSIGIAWLGNTWSRERPEHKTAFLETLRTGLSMADEVLLQTAAQDKNQAVRRLAGRLLLLLPGSAWYNAIHTWLKAKLQAGLHGRRLYGVLLHGLSEAGRPEELGSLPAGEAGVQTLLELLPPQMIASASGMPPAVLLQETGAADYPGPARDAWLSAIGWNGDPVWLLEVVRIFQDQPTHPVWTSMPMKTILQALPEPLWQSVMPELAQRFEHFETPASALVQALLEAEYSWPKRLLEAVLFYPLRSQRPRQWAPPGHLQALLKRAAYRCHPADADVLPAADSEWPYAWHSELIQLRSVIHFRQRLRVALAP
ncbi:MAG: hypothetical protein IPH12_00320 [Saprospirales bacterium]|nr:hypothetical protein [Saprospirales bacterium]